MDTLYKHCNNSVRPQLEYHNTYNITKTYHKNFKHHIIYRLAKHTFQLSSNQIYSRLSKVYEILSTLRSTETFESLECIWFINLPNVDEKISKLHMIFYTKHPFEVIWFQNNVKKPRDVDNINIVTTINFHWKIHFIIKGVHRKNVNKSPSICNAKGISYLHL